MESKARRRKLSRKCSHVAPGNYQCFPTWLASKLRLRSVFRDKNPTFAETAFEKNDINVTESAGLIRS
jgi:hypothetical protein